MSKIFVKTNRGNQVETIHYMPFDKVHGLGKSESELLADGFLVDSIPDPEDKTGKIPIAYCTKEKGIYYEYVDAPNPYGITENTYQKIQHDLVDEIVSAVGKE